MASYYQNIQGWFDFENIYKAQLHAAKDGDVFVEIGVWKGRSAVFMAENIKESGKAIKFYGVDSFQGCDVLKEQINQLEAPLLDILLDNIEKAGVSKYIEILLGRSDELAEEFQDEEVTFAFLDADHTYEKVKADLAAWWPKIKHGGVLGGHDYVGWPGVKSAVDEFVRENKLHLDTDWSSWLVSKPF